MKNLIQKSLGRKTLKKREQDIYREEKAEIGREEKGLKESIYVENLLKGNSDQPGQQITQKS